MIEKTRIRQEIKNGKYYAVVTCTENNQRKIIWRSLGVSTKDPKRLVERRFQEAKEYFEELYPSPDNILFTRYLADWVEGQKGRVATSTWEGYCTYAHKHIIPYFEPLHLRLTELTPKHIEEYYSSKYNGGRCDRKQGGLAIESIIKHKSVLMKSLNDAVIQDLIQRNPAQYVPLPARRSSKRKENFLSLDQATQMLEILSDTPLYALVYTTLYYGLRKSEALGLKWSSVDFINKTLTIENAVVKNLTIEEKPTLKNSASYHTFPLIPDVEYVLMEERARQRSAKEALGDNYIDSDFVFTREDGRPFRSDTVYCSFQRKLKAKGFSPIIRFHDLRHSTASILYGLGWDLKDIQMWLRHADIKVTANVYTHIQKQSVKAPDYMKNLFSPKPTPKAQILDVPDIDTQ